MTCSGELYRLTFNVDSLPDVVKSQNRVRKQFQGKIIGQILQWSGSEIYLESWH